MLRAIFRFCRGNLSKKNATKQLQVKRLMDRLFCENLFLSKPCPIRFFDGIARKSDWGIFQLIDA